VIVLEGWLGCDVVLVVVDESFIVVCELFFVFEYLLLDFCCGCEVW